MMIGGFLRSSAWLSLAEVGHVAWKERSARQRGHWERHEAWHSLLVVRNGGCVEGAGGGGEPGVGKTLDRGVSCAFCSEG